MDKKKFNIPEVIIITLDKDNVIATSGFDDPMPGDNSFDFDSLFGNL